MMTEPDSPPIVLVVEDEMVLRMRAVDIVQDAGFVPIEAVSADQALLAARRCLILSITGWGS